MAGDQNQAARGLRLTALGAAAGLALSTALAFGRVFRGREATLKLLAAAALSVGLAAALERRSLLLATLASAALLLVALTWLVFPHTVWNGLPSRETLGALARSLELVGRQARVQVAPTRPLDPLLLAAITAVWTASFSAHALAVRAGSPLLAILPQLALLGFADTVLEDGARPAYALLFLLAALAVVFTDGLRRVRLWGPVWPSPGLRRRRVASATTRGARRVVLLVVGAAVFLPGILPGFGAPSIVDFSTSSGDDVYIDPFVRVAAQLRQEEPKALFEVRSAAPTYLRMLSLDRFDARTGTWTTVDPELATAQTFSSGGLLPLPALNGPSLHQDVRVLTDLVGRWIPVGYPAGAITLSDGDVRYDADRGTAVSTEKLSAGAEYSVESHPLYPTREELDAEVFADPTSYGPETEVPDELASDLRLLSESWAGDPSLPPFERIWNVQQHLRDTREFTYDDRVEPVDDSQALIRFLTVEKRGFCQQYATAMALLVRSLGYPARVVVGFRQGSLKQPGVRLVTTKDAHTWVEVEFPTYGWLTFEPTPTRNAPGANTYLAPPIATGSQGGSGAPTPGGGEGVGLPQLDNVDRLRGRVRGPGGTGLITPSPVPLPEEAFRIGYGLMLRVAGALLALFLLLFPPAKALVRRARLRRAAGDPQTAILATYRLFAGRAADVGFGRGPGETPDEYRRRLRARVVFSDGHLDRLTRIVSLAAYGPRPPDVDSAREARKDARVAIRDVRRTVGPIRRVLGAYRPSI